MSKSYGQFTFSGRFFAYLRYLRCVSGSLDRKGQVLRLDNDKLKAAASRINVPYPFTPYMGYIEEATNRPFPDDLKFTKEEVIAEDLSIIESFKQPQLELSGLNLDFLFEAAHSAANELGLIGQKYFKQYSVDESIDSFAGNTSASYPTFKKKETAIARNDAKRWTLDIISKFKFWSLMTQPCAVFHRFQYKVKTLSKGFELRKKIRPVWGVPFRVLTLEGIYFRGIVDSFVYTCLGQPEPMCSTGRTKKQISTDIISRFRNYGSNIVSVDYKRFDSTVPSFAWSLFYAVVHDSAVAANPHFNEETYKGLMAFHCFTPYCWNSTDVKYQRRGVPSGSLLTSTFNSFVNRTLINYASLEASNGKFLPRQTACVLGDDLLFVETVCTLNHLSNVAKRFGMVIQVDECTVNSPDAHFDFLGYFWDNKNRPYQVMEWYIAHLCLPSRFIDLKQYPEESLDYLQTCRGICVCMGLYRGMDMFYYLVGSRDRIYISFLEEYSRGIDPIVRYVGEDSTLFNLRIPLSKIFEEGWEAF